MKQASSGEEPRAEKRKIEPVLNVNGSTREDTFYQGTAYSLRETLEHELYCYLQILALQLDDENADPLEFWKREEDLNRFLLLKLIARYVYNV